jgi:predicted dehydrogenase
MDLKIAVLGAGYASHLRCNAIKKVNNSSISIKSVFDKNQMHSEEFAKEFSVKYYNNISEVWEDHDINTVLICTPNKYHFDLVKNALDKERNVICEYPLTVSKYSDAEELIKTANEKKLFIHVGQTMNFDADSSYVISNIKKLGKLLMGYKYMSFGKLGSWFDLKKYRGIGSWYVEEKESGSWFVSAHYHGIQMFRNIFGEVGSVYAIDSSIKGVRAGTIILNHTGGAGSTIQWGMPLSGKPFNIMIISGADGSIETNDNEFQLQSGEFQDEGRLEEKDTFLDDCKDLLVKIKSPDRFEKGYEDMLKSLKISFFAEESAKKNKVIKL